MERVDQKLGGSSPGAQSLERAIEVFHNFAITSPMSRDARECHQVRHETRSNATDPVATTISLAPRTRSESATAQGINGFSLKGLGRQRRHDSISEDATCQPFQGGGTGSNPVGGATENGRNPNDCRGLYVTGKRPRLSTNVLCKTPVDARQTPIDAQRLAARQ
jgi:hypothetical protein